MKIKSFYGAVLNKLDQEVNDFETMHKVKATQSYYADGLHIRVVFYEDNNN